MDAYDPYPPKNLPGDPYATPVIPPTYYPNVIDDVTPYVHRARNSQFCRDGGTIYFPASKDSGGNVQSYVGAFEFLNSNGEVNIEGDGAASMLKSNGTNKFLGYNPLPPQNPIYGDPNPVLRLGLAPWWWRQKKVSNLVVNGTPSNLQPKFSDGIVFDDPEDPKSAGRWTLEGVTILGCNIGIHKPKGNIGNSYQGCLLSGNNFGYFAKTYTPPGLPGMHAGCDTFIGGHIEGSSSAGICVIANGQYGQLIIDGTIIEYNPGFGIFIKTTGEARASFTPVEIRNIWMEVNDFPRFYNKLFDYNVNPAVEKGSVSAHFNPVTGYLYLSIEFSGLSGSITSAGIYLSGVNIFSLSGYPPSVTSGAWIETVLIINPLHITSLYTGNLSIEINTSLTPEVEAVLPAISNIVIDGITYTPDQWRTLQFEGIRSVSISNTQVIDIKLIDSSVKLNACRSDDRFTISHQWPHRVDVDATSQLIADDLMYYHTVKENIFVNSISYNGSSDILFLPSIANSVWGPLRVTIVAGINNLLMSSGQTMESQIWQGYAGYPDAYAMDMPNAGTMINNIWGGLTQTCKVMPLNPGDVVHSPDFFSITASYVFWSIHAYQCGEADTITGYFGTPPIGGDPDAAAYKLGQVIFKKGQWTCSYGIKKMEIDDYNGFRLWFFGNANGGTFRFCHYQVLAFDNLYDAQSYANSRAFAIPGEVCSSDG